MYYRRGLFICNTECECIIHPPLTGADNMRFDNERARAVLHGTAQPCFRLYTWHPWCISLGYHQQEKTIDMQCCQNYGWDIVRRPTGGKAVLHAEEITYSLIIPLPDGNPQEAYRLSHEFLRILLCSFLPPTEHSALQFSATSARFAEDYRSDPSAELCFARSAQYELSWSGRKLVGSAQRLFRHGSTTVLLQHGSIPCSSAHTRITEVLSSTHEQPLVLQQHLADKSAGLHDIIGKISAPQEYLQSCAHFLDHYISTQIL